MSPMKTVHEAWVLKKPSANKGDAWSAVRPQRRYVESKGFHVEYYADVPAKRKPTSKPRGAFDLRDVSMLRESADPSAPSTALDLCCALPQSSRAALETLPFTAKL